MIKINTISKNLLIVALSFLCMGGFFAGTASAIAPPLEPGCYNNNSGDFAPIGCATEGQARSIVPPLNKCFVINANNGGQGGPVNREVNCATGGIVTASSPPASESECDTRGGTWRPAGTTSGGISYGFYCDGWNDDAGEAPQTQDECVAEGGSWRAAGNAGGVEYGFYCDGWQGSPAGGPADGDDDTPSDPGSSGGRLESRPDDCNAEELNGENCGIVNYLNIFMNLVSGAIAIAVIGNIIYAGIQYSMAQGDPGNAAKAKNRIRGAIIAFIMYVSLFGFLQWLIPGGVF